MNNKILVKLVVLVSVLGGAVTPVHPAFNHAQEILKAKLQNAAQNALNAIDSGRTLLASENRAARGQHVFNNGLLGLHRSVLQHLLRDVGGYDEQLENLSRDLIIPLSRTEQNAVGSMVAHFSRDEFYVDYNADVYGAYVMELRRKSVECLKGETSVKQDERYGIRGICQRVRFIASQMVDHEVYVDPMARDRWLQENPRDVQQYEQVRRALKEMFSEFLQVFEIVVGKIIDFRQRNNWTWDEKRR